MAPSGEINCSGGSGHRVRQRADTMSGPQPNGGPRQIGETGLSSERPKPSAGSA